jgi:hypothetical protein
LDQAHGLLETMEWKVVAGSTHRGVNGIQQAIPTGIGFVVSDLKFGFEDWEIYDNGL